MNHEFYFDGRQIKNYLIGFASLFSEIPYKNRVGKLESVPIHYGSPSDIISHLEMNVDNDETTNRNRIKDISVPMFSFRMTGMERNSEKRRAPHDTITVDLRPMGYSTGYVTMRPAPIRFTMELICWASSDYQAFEISEQIIPYFNSPQQVSIEPLPRCPVSTSEVFLETVEIDTEPESQRYSAMVTMSFNLNGWLLTQPRIWSTNMKFEFQMLDKEYQGTDTPANLDDTDWSVGHEIIDTNDTPPPLLPTEQKLSSIDSFIRNTVLASTFGEKLDIYNELVMAGRISKAGQIIDTTPLPLVYKDKEMLIELPMMNLLVDDMSDLEFLYSNEKLLDSLKSHTIRDDISIYKSILEDDTDVLDVYLKLLDNNLVTKGFNRTEAEFSNSDKLNMFGSTRIDIEDKLERLRSYLAGIENLKIKRDPLLSMGILDDEYKVYMFSIDSIPFDDFPETFKSIDGNSIDSMKKDLGYTKASLENENVKVRVVSTTTISNENTIFISKEELVESVVPKINLDETIDIDFGPADLSNPKVFSVTSDNSLGFNPIGIMVVSTENYPKFDEIEFEFNGKIYNLEDLWFVDNIHNLFNEKDFINDRFINLDDYVVSTLLFKQLERTGKPIKEAYNESQNVKIYENKYQGSFDKMISEYARLKGLVVKIDDNIDKIEPKGISAGDLAQEQINIAPDLSQSIGLDKNGNPIYDINGDGIINIEDLKLLGAEVDNPEDYDFVLKYGVWYKRFDPDKVSEERLKRIMSDLKILFYLTEKEDMSELRDYITLLEKDLVTDGYDLYDDTMKQKEIKAMGYDLTDLDDKLFVDSIKNIMVKERDFIIYYVPDMNEESKRMLYMEEGLDIDKIIIGKFIDQFFRMNLDDDQRLEDMSLFRRILPNTMGNYMNYSYQFDIFMQDIKKTQLFIDSLEAKTPWLTENLPEVEQKINDKYLSGE
jgi:hypothetical protein